MHKKIKLRTRHGRDKSGWASRSRLKIEIEIKKLSRYIERFEIEIKNCLDTSRRSKLSSPNCLENIEPNRDRSGQVETGRGRSGSRFIPKFRYKIGLNRDIYLDLSRNSYTK